MRSSDLIGLLVISISLLGMYVFIKRLERKAKLILNNEWCKNEALISLLSKSKYTDFIHANGMLMQNTNHVRLLKEYVNNEKQIKTYGTRILRQYYYSLTKESELADYEKFKQNIEQR